VQKYHHSEGRKMELTAAEHDDGAGSVFDVAGFRLCGCGALCVGGEGSDLEESNFV
jgi:hypothetical protein